ncbi:MAG: hypothetical protein H2055_10165 [Sphingopyxis sp.]|jgi:hypothetical protein|nr:hypothetical protein [Sphingopyxis sp.]
MPHPHAIPPMPFPASQMIAVPAAAAPRKITRDRFEILRVEAEPSPHVIQHVLDIVARHGIFPFAIMVQHHALWQLIEAEIPELPESGARTLLRDLQRSANVRSATSLRPKRRAEMYRPRKF